MSQGQKKEARENRVNFMISTIIENYILTFSKGLIVDGVPGPVLKNSVKKIYKSRYEGIIVELLEAQGYPGGRENFLETFDRWLEDHQPQISDGAEVY